MNNINSRKIYRHESNKGSVIEFTDVNGEVKHLFVADAAFRDSGIACAERVVRSVDSWGDSWSADLFGKYGYTPIDKPLDYNLSDDEVKRRLGYLGDVRDISPAAENTTDLAQSPYNMEYCAAKDCRKVEVDGIGSLDLPTIYELAIIFLEAENIDALDPTVSENPGLMLGSKGANHRFGGQYGNGCHFAWSCTRGNDVEYYYEDEWAPRYDRGMFGISGAGAIQCRRSGKIGMVIPTKVLD